MEKVFLHLHCVGWVEYSPSPKGRNPLQQKNRRKSKSLRHVLGKRPSSPFYVHGIFSLPAAKILDRGYLLYLLRTERFLRLHKSQQDDGSKTCWPVERQSRYYVTEWGRIEGGEEAMMSEIFSRGPIGCGTMRKLAHFSTVDERCWSPSGTSCFCPADTAYVLSAFDTGIAASTRAALCWSIYSQGIVFVAHGAATFTPVVYLGILFCGG